MAEKATIRKKGRIEKFFDGVRAEYRKIIWTSRPDIIKQTTAVVVISVISGALIAVLDYLFGIGINFLTQL